MLKKGAGEACHGRGGHKDRMQRQNAKAQYKGTRMPRQGQAQGQDRRIVLDDVFWHNFYTMHLLLYQVINLESKKLNIRQSKHLAKQTFGLKHENFHNALLNKAMCHVGIR